MRAIFYTSALGRCAYFTMAKGNQKSAIHLEVFTDHYATLIETLPVKSLVAKFVSAKIIEFSDQDEILKGETPEDKARRFLQHIVNTLKSGNSETFLAMLDVIEKHGGQYAHLAHNIRKDLSKRESSRETTVAVSEDHPDNPDVVTPKSKAQGSSHWRSILVVQLYRACAGVYMSLTSY